MRPVAWFTEDHLIDKSATTYDPVVAERWRKKGWPVTAMYGVEFDVDSLLGDVALFLSELPDDLGRGSLNGMRAQLIVKVAVAARGGR